MKKRMLKPFAVLAAGSVMLMSGAVSASAMTVSQGISAELSADSQTDSGAEITGSVKNSNYYDVDNISCEATITSGSATLSGETKKDDFSIKSGESGTLTFSLSLDNAGEASTADSSKADSSKAEASSSDSAAKPTDSVSSSSVSSSTASTSSTSSAATLTSGTPTANPNTGGTMGKAAAAAAAIGTASLAVYAVFKKNKKMLSLAVCCAMASSVLCTSLPVSALEAQEGYLSITDTLELDINGETVTVELTVVFPDQPIHDNSEEDIQRLNNGEASIVRYDKTGRLAFIGGKYTDYKVTDPESAMSSLAALYTLLDAKDNDITMNLTRVDTADNGDVFYTFEQNQGLAIVSDAYIKIGTDKDGNTICLSSSIDPEATAIADFDEADAEASLVTAIETAKKYADENNCSFIADAKPEYVIHNNSLGEPQYCWVFYLKINDTVNAQNTNGTDSAGFLKVFINAVTGEFYDAVNVSSANYGNGDPEENDVYFKNETQLMEFTDYLGNKVELPVAQNENGYYFVDNERKIICIDSDKTYTDNGSEMLDIVPYTFSSPEELSPVFVSVFENMRKIYDMYKSEGIDSVDGHGIPLAIGFGFPGEGEDPINACYMANIGGFGCFLFSDTYISVSIDVAGHEFTHAVRRSLNCASAYQNNTGAMEEGYADILGNLLQLKIEPDIADWYIAETCGQPIRSLADPHEFCQPEYIGDMFYVMNSRFVYSTTDDNGGVHTNSSVIAHACYEMTNTAGINVEDNFDIWKYTLNTLTPICEFKQASEMVYFAMDRLGMSDKKADVQAIFEKGRLSNDTTSWEGYETPEGAVKLDFVLENAPADYEWAVIYAYVTESGVKTATITSDANNVAQSFVPPQEQAIVFIVIVQDGEQTPISVFEQGYAPILEDTTITYDYNDLPAQAAG